MPKNIVITSSILGFILGLTIISLYSINNKIGDSGIVYVFLIIVISTLYGYLNGIIFKISKKKGFLAKAKGVWYILVVFLLTLLLVFIVYVLLFALDFTGGY